MEWLKQLTPLLGVAIGWGLSQFSQLWITKRQDRQKLKKLLYYLLELRFKISREHHLEKSLFEFYSRAIETVQKRFPNEPKIDFTPFLPYIKNALKKNFIDESQIGQLDQNIELVINELAEIYPVFAHELAGQFKVREKLGGIDKYFDDMEFIAGSNDKLKSYFKPKVVESLLSKMEITIFRIANTIGQKSKVASLIREEDNFVMDIDECIDIEDFMRHFPKPTSTAIPSS